MIIRLLTALSVALVAAGGYCFGAGAPLPGYLLSALGAGWLGILYGALTANNRRGVS